MKNSILLSAPTARLQIGNQVIATIDTASKNGKKSYQINIETQDDTLKQDIEEAVSEVKNVVNDVKNSIEDKESENDYQTEIRQEDHRSFERVVDKSVPIVLFLCIFGYLAFRSFQKRKWMETLLNKGMDSNEISNLTDKLDKDMFNKSPLLEGLSKIDSFEKQKSLKYSIVFGSFGLAVIIGTTMDEFGYFIGFLFLFLASGFWYYNNKIN
jgi:hypothetical protein